MTEITPKNGAMFRSLRSYNARLFFLGLLFSNVGSWLQLTATSFLLYRLTGSAVTLGVNTALQFLPMLLLGAWAGALSDRFNRRRITLVTQSLMALQAIVLGVCDITGNINVPIVFALTGMLGLVGAIDNPARRALVTELVPEAEAVLNLNPGFRQRTILRIDGGGGNDADINHLLARRYQLLVKVTHWKRVEKLATTVADWERDPKDPKRQAGWVQQPFAYNQPTRQLAVRCQTKKGAWQTTILVFNLADDQLHWLNQQGKRPFAPPADPIWLAVYAYDLRGGGVETAIKGSKQGLGIIKRNKKSFHAQEMLLLLGQLAYNVTAWVRNGLASCEARLRQFGMLRMVRDAFHIAGLLTFNAEGHIVQISLNQAHNLAASFIDAFASFLARDGTVANLRQI